MGFGRKLLEAVRSLLSGDLPAHLRTRRFSGGEQIASEYVVTAQPTIYPWYETIRGDSIEQGDLLFDFEVFVPMTPSRAGDEVAGEMMTLDVIVMTQTCDIVHGKVGSVLLCPWQDLWEFVDAAKSQGENWGSNQRDALRKGNLAGYHLLNDASQDGITIGLGVVDFHEVYTAPTEQVSQFAGSQGNRLRLCPPYKEHLAQAFARFFMRVGLPVDIAPEKLKSRPE
jgi:hypothetical protein